MDQANTSTQRTQNGHPVTVAAPHRWDGIGQALRCAYGSHHGQPSEIAQAMQALELVD